MSPGFKATCAALLAVGACVYYLAPQIRRDRAAAPAAVDAITAKKRQIFERAAARPADPDLASLYGEINDRHFGGSLPAIPVVWEDGLKELDLLIGDDAHLNGMTNGRMMLISTALADDGDELRRTVCHEAVHVKLQPTPGTNGHRDGVVRHDAAFQEALRRIFAEGCFAAILASEEERAALKDWIDQEKARLDEEGAHLDLSRARLNAERSEVESAIAALNARTAAGYEQPSQAPAETEMESVRARRARAIEESENFNAALERHNAAVANLNREIERYRLMLAYPYGIDDEAPPAAARDAGR